MANTARMTALQRREQLIRVGRALFASKGFEAVSVEEIAANAKVSKPIVYEHFGGKEGLYAVIVDREMRELTNALIEALSDTKAHPRQIVERAALALLTYIEENSEGFQVLVRDSPATDPAGSFNSLLGDMTVFTGQYWADRPKVNKEQLAAYIVDLAWHGLSRLDSKPILRFESQKAKQLAAKEDKERRDKERSETTAPDEPDAPVETAEPDEPAYLPASAG